jgi:hypothetical protein
MFCTDAFFEVAEGAIVDLDYSAALSADQVMVMSVRPLLQQLKTGYSIPEIIPFHHSHGFKQVQGAVNGHQVRIPAGQTRMNLASCQRVLLTSKKFQHCLARPRELE